MRIISHRGNLNGRSYLENHPEYIKEALQEYDVEVDVWVINNQLFLGHDKPVYSINLDFFTQNMWIHCKNIDAVHFFKTNNNDLNWFWHENDKLTLTNKGYIWCYPGTYLENGVTVELEYKDLPKIMGVCTDYPHLYLSLIHI